VSQFESFARERRLLISFLVLAGTIAWLASVIWQLWLAETEGKVWSQTGFVTRESNETIFDASVCFYWVALAFGTVILFVMTIATIKGISN
jgi:hypothetical protein